MKNILVIGSSGSGKTTYIAKLVNDLHLQGEKIYLLDYKGALKEKLSESVLLEEAASEDTILVVDDAEHFAIEDFPYKNILLCANDRIKFEDLSALSERCDEYHLFTFRPENGFKASDILGDVGFESFTLPKFKSFVLKKNEQ